MGWIQSAVPKGNKGKFTAKAEAAGRGVQEYAEEKKNAPGALGKEARLALTFARMSRAKKRRG